MSMLKKELFALILAASMLGACTAPSAPTQPSITQTASQNELTPEPIAVRVGIQPFASNLPLYIALSEGYFTEQGLDVEFINFLRGQELLAALVLGEIDATGTAISSSQFLVIQETPGLSFVADKGYLDPESCTYSGFMAPKELIESGELDDLSNFRNLAVAATRSTVINLYVLDILLKPVGLTNEDIEFVELPTENRLEAFRNGAIDIGVIAEPTITRIVEAGVAEVWLGWEEILPGTQLGTLWYGPKLTQENRDAGNRFMIAYLKAIRQYNEGKTDRNVELMAEFTQLSLEEARNMCWQAVRSDGAVNFESIQDFQEWAVRQGLQDTVLPVEAYWDGEFIEYALEHGGNE